MNELHDMIFDPQKSFEEKAMKVFRYQYENNKVYNRFCDALDMRNPDFEQIPLLPIEAFKEVDMKSGDWNEPELLFYSSGTSGMSRSKHLVRMTDIYRQSIIKGFKSFYDLNNIVFWGYTPGYAENPNSSLIWMINELIHQDDLKLSHFLPLEKPLDQYEIDDVAASGKRLMIFGAAFGLLDLMEISDVSFPKNTLIMETGGMKTYKREMTRYELHWKLSDGFQLPFEQIHSEYGMTELLSQAYALGTEWFETPKWLRVSIRDPENPMQEVPDGQVGLIGIMDLANLYSCSFILTGDVGIKRMGEAFQVKGRWKKTNLRGCNFLIDRD